MRWTLRTRWSTVIALVGLGLTLPAAAGALAPGVGASFASGDPLLIQAKHAKVHVKSFNGKTVKVNKHVHVNKNVYVKNKNIYVNKKVVVARPYRAWVRRPYYGTYVAGVALGTILAVTGVPVAPAPNLCWYWANPAMTRGYLGLLLLLASPLPGLVRTGLHLHAGLFCCVRVLSRLRL